MMSCHSKVVFTIPGPAQAKQRPRMNIRTGCIYTPSATHKYEKLVKESYGDNPCFENQFINIKILFKFEVPKSYSKKERAEALTGNLKPTKGDIDNYIKSVLDGLNKVAFLDDRYICSITAEKIFAEESEVIVEIKN